MRILGHIDHPTYKITVLKTEHRLLVKIENQSYEQTFKIRAREGLQNLGDVQAFLSPKFLQEIDQAFRQMHISYLKNLNNLNEEEEEKFDEII